MTTTRRDFLERLLHVSLLPLLGLETACGESSDSSADAGSNDAGDTPDAGNGDAATGDAGSDGSVASCSTVSSTIGANHGHSLVVPAADVAAGVETSYTLTSNGGHSHTLLVTAAEFATLATGASVIKASATSPSPGHEHTVTLMCG